MLYTVLRPDSGDALIDGISASDQSLEARRRMGVLPHNAGIYPHLTARENIEYLRSCMAWAARNANSAQRELI